jgi:hypothetical protein
MIPTLIGIFGTLVLVAAIYALVILFVQGIKNVVTRGQAGWPFRRGV